jgi:hypothetical protein
VRKVAVPGHYLHTDEDVFTMMTVEQTAREGDFRDHHDSRTILLLDGDYHCGDCARLGAFVYSDGSAACPAVGFTRAAFPACVLFRKRGGDNG